MSIEAQRLVRAVGELTGPQKAVLAAYAAYADESGYCWAGTARIAFDTAFSLATVGRARRALIRRGWLKSRRRLGTSSVTRLNLARIAEAGIDTGPARPRRPLLIEFADPGPDARAAPSSPRRHRRRHAARASTSRSLSHLPRTPHRATGRMTGRMTGRATGRMTLFALVPPSPLTLSGTIRSG